MSEEGSRTKRSRFDQTEPEPRKHSRFDRRSRSPSSRQTETGRSRSPLSKDPRSPASETYRADPAAAAGKFDLSTCKIQLTLLIAAAAAKINAELQARKGIQHADVPPIRSVSARVEVPLSRLIFAQTTSPLPKTSSPSENTNEVQATTVAHVAASAANKEFGTFDEFDRPTVQASRFKSWKHQKLK